MKDEIIDYSIVEHLPDGSQRFWTEEQFRQAYGCSYEEYRDKLERGSGQFLGFLWRLLGLLGRGLWVLTKVAFVLSIGTFGLVGRLVKALAEGIVVGVLGVFLAR